MATLFGILFINLEPSLGQFLEPSWEPFGNLLGNRRGNLLGTFKEPSLQSLGGPFLEAILELKCKFKVTLYCKFWRRC